MDLNTQASSSQVSQIRVSFSDPETIRKESEIPVWWAELWPPHNTSKRSSEQERQEVNSDNSRLEWTCNAKVSLMLIVVVEPDTFTSSVITFTFLL